MYWKSRAGLITAVMAVMLTLTFACQSMAAVLTTKTLTIKTSYGKSTVKAVYVPLNDPGIRIFPVLAKNQIGKTEPLQSMAKRSNALAAINGTFFSAYSDLQPQGSLQINGIFHYINNTGCSLGITNTGKARIENIRFKIEGKIDGPSKTHLDPWEQFQKNWYAWSINRVDTNPAAITIYTPAKGSFTGQKSGTNVVVTNGTVTKISYGNAPIPTNGYIINFGPNSAPQYVPRFQVGDSVDYRFKTSDPYNNPVDWSNVVQTVGVGPMLVSNGVIDVDFNRDAMRDPKLTANSGARSFIGINSANQLVMATVPTATIRQLAAIAQKMGLRQAMNLDGGASSGLYYGGKCLTSPGRNLSNCIVVARSKNSILP